MTKFKVATQDLINAYNTLDVSKSYVILEGEHPEKRTTKQNSSIHLYCSMLAEAFNDAGLDMRVVLKPEVDIDWTTENVKKYMWKPIQKSLLGIESTKDLKKHNDINKVWEHINRHISQKFSQWVTPMPFPSLENQTKEVTQDLMKDYKPAEEPAF